MSDKSYIIEFLRVGAQQKVTAVDPDTGTEVSIIGPLNATRQALSTLAVRKLEYVLRKANPTA